MLDNYVKKPEDVIHTDHNGVEVIHLVDAVHPAGHRYVIQHPDYFASEVLFQNGPVKEVGINGITNEALLAVVLHRLRELNKQFPCRENSLAITNIEQGVMWLEARTKDRIQRKVEGLNKV